MSHWHILFRHCIFVTGNLLLWLSICERAPFSAWITNWLHCILIIYQPNILFVIRVENSSDNIRRLIKCSNTEENYTIDGLPSSSLSWKPYDVVVVWCVGCDAKDWLDPPSFVLSEAVLNWEEFGDSDLVLRWNKISMNMVVCNQ